MDKEIPTPSSLSINPLYKKMIEEIQDYAIILIDRNGFIQNWNKGAQKIKLYSEKEILGKHFSIFYLQKDLDDNLPQKLLKQAIDTGSAEQEGWRKRKDGSKFWGSITITALHDDDDTVLGFCKVTRDLTDKKIAEEKLRMSEDRYQRMIAEVQDYAIILLSVDGIIENWNIGAGKIKGYKAHEIIGKKFEIFYTEEDKENGLPTRLLQEAVLNGKATHQGWRLRKDGTRFWGTIVITALHGKDGSVIGFSKVTRDLTQQKIAEDKLAAYTAELEIQNSELEQFAYVASHDLQEPLRKIRTFADLIRENYGDKNFTDTYFEKLDLSAKRMAELIRSLLNYSRLAKVKSTFGEVDLTLVIEAAKQDFELLIEEKNAVITYDKLPIVTGDQVQLEQLFCNLISNSLKFCKVDPHVKISFKIVDTESIDQAPKSLTYQQYYQITLEDNGIGFEQQYNQQIFSLFQRLHGKQDYSGTGIGLALCKKIAENHKGIITATGESGNGARFDVYLPVISR